MCLREREICREREIKYVCVSLSLCMCMCVCVLQGNKVCMIMHMCEIERKTHINGESVCEREIVCDERG